MPPQRFSARNASRNSQKRPAESPHASAEALQAQQTPPATQLTPPATQLTPPEPARHRRPRKKVHIDETATQQASQASQISVTSLIPAPAPARRRGRPRKQPRDDFAITEDETATQQASLGPSQALQTRVLREDPFKANRGGSIAWNEPPTGFIPLYIEPREPQLHMPFDFNSSSDEWPSAVAFFDLYFPNWLLSSIADNTNEYWQLNAPSDKRVLHARSWTNTTVAELYGFIAVQVLMGLVGHEKYAQFWTREHPTYYEQIRGTLSLRRYETLQQYFHIDPPTPDAPEGPPEDITPAAAYRSTPERLKVTILENHVKNITRRLLTPGSELAIDEMTQLFTGRSMYIMALPMKPAGEGFKMHAIADSATNVIFDWRYVERKQGIVSVDPYWTRGPYQFAGSKAVVMELASHLERRPEASYCLFLDNFYTSKDLFKALRERGIGAHGTAKTSRGTGVHPELAKLKNGQERMPGWGHFKATHDEGVMQVSWQDSVPTLFMSTVDDATSFVQKDRWRPPKASSQASIDDWEQQGEPSTTQIGARRVYLPTFVDKYNRHMNAVDVANQMRDEYATRRPHWRGWKALWHLLLDLALTNAFELRKLYFMRVAQPHPAPLPTDSVKDFRHNVVVELMKRAERVVGKPSFNQPRLPQSVQPVESRLHELGKLPQSLCRACVTAGRKAGSRRRRFGPVAYMTTKQRERGRAPRTSYACITCRINLCQGGPCWEEHLVAVGNLRGDAEAA